MVMDVAAMRFYNGCPEAGSMLPPPIYLRRNGGFRAFIPIWRPPVDNGGHDGTAGNPDQHIVASRAIYKTCKTQPETLPENGRLRVYRQTSRK